MKKPIDSKHQGLDTSEVKSYEALFSKNLREGVKIGESEIREIRNRLNSGELNSEDVAFLDGLMSKTLRGIRALTEDNVFETLPNGMDIIK